MIVLLVYPQQCRQAPGLLQFSGVTTSVSVGRASSAPARLRLIVNASGG